MVAKNTIKKTTIWVCQRLCGVEAECPYCFVVASRQKSYPSVWKSGDEIRCEACGKTFELEKDSLYLPPVEKKYKTITFHEENGKYVGRDRRVPEVLLCTVEFFLTPKHWGIVFRGNVVFHTGCLEEIIDFTGRLIERTKGKDD